MTMVRTYAYLDSGKLVLTDVASAHFKRSGRLDLSGNLDLLELPEGLRVEQLFLRGCTRLTRLPDRLDVKLLELGRLHGHRQPADGIDVRYSQPSAERDFARYRTTCR